MSIVDLFDPQPGLTYLDAATYGLPPRPTVAALQRALDRWQSGVADWVNEWDREGEVCRTLFAQLIGAEDAEIALLPTVSTGVGLVAASLQAGDRVLVADDEFTSVLYPFLVAREARQVTIVHAPFADLATAINAETTLVAFSLTRSQDGSTAALEEICAAAARVGARVLVDSTHATPFLPVASELPRIDYLVCHGYKHLLCPRGVAFLYIRQERWPQVAPFLANWRSGSPLYGRNYGGDLDLPQSAARYDVSLAWHAWAGARQSLELLVKWQRDGVLQGPLDLAARLARGIGLPEPSATLVSFRFPDADRAEAALAEAGIRCASRGGYIRLSPHVYNTEAEIDRAIETIVTLREAPRQG